MLNLIALVFAGILVASVAVAVGCSNVGPSIGMAAVEFQKLAPNYWNNAGSKISYNIIQAPSLVGPAWSPDELPGARPKKATKKLRLPTQSRPVAQEPPAFEDDLLELPAGDAADMAGFWADSPSPLGRVA